jgi:hypothetical protein
MMDDRRSVRHMRDECTGEFEKHTGTGPFLRQPDTLCRDRHRAENLRNPRMVRTYAGYPGSGFSAIARSFAGTDVRMAVMFGYGVIGTSAGALHA